MYNPAKQGRDEKGRFSSGGGIDIPGVSGQGFSRSDKAALKEIERTQGRSGRGRLGVLKNAKMTTPGQLRRVTLSTALPKPGAKVLATTTETSHGPGSVPGRKNTDVGILQKVIKGKGETLAKVKITKGPNRGRVTTFALKDLKVRK